MSSNQITTAQQSDEQPPPARTVANRRNARLSTGPSSVVGKSKVRLNALKTGLTGRTVLLPGDDAAGYANYGDILRREYMPVGTRECELVQAITDTRWRLARIPSLESNIYALAEIEFSDLFPDLGRVVRHGLIEAKAFLAYQRQFSNLSLQEGRLRRQFQKDLAELNQLQLERRLEEQAKDEQAPEPAAASAHAHPDANPHTGTRQLPLEQPHNGFEFSSVPEPHPAPQPEPLDFDFPQPKAA